MGRGRGHFVLVVVVVVVVVVSVRWVKSREMEQEFVSAVVQSPFFLPAAACFIHLVDQQTPRKC